MNTLRVAQLPDGRRAIIIRTSDSITFKKCRRSWSWSSHLKKNLGPSYLPSPLWFGSAVHYALEDFHGFKHFETAEDAFRAYCIATSKQHLRDLPDDAPELFKMGSAMMDYYQNGWLSERKADATYWELDPHTGLEVPQVEVNFEIPVPLEDHPILAHYAREHGADCVLYRGTIDRISEDEFGRIWIVEYKTAKVAEHMHYQTDPQVTRYCVPLSTQILTRAGWKNYSDLTIGEDVLGYNQETNQTEWTKLTAVNLPGKSPLNKISGKSFEFRATPDHRWVRGVKSKGLAYKNKPQTRVIVDTLDKYKDNSYLILSAPYKGGKGPLTPDEAGVLGWILTDGSHTRADCVSITQKKHVQEVQALLDKFPDCYSRVTDNNGTTVWHLRSTFTDSLWQKASMRHTCEDWQQFVLGMSSGALQAFCTAAMLGDGSIGTKGQQSFHQNKGLKQDLFRLAFFLLGHFPGKELTTCKNNPWSDRTDGATFSLTTSRKWMKPVKIEAAGEEEVWCPTTELGTWVMRQGELIAITGNCWAAQHMYPDKEIAGVVYHQFVKKVPELPRIIGKGVVSTASNLTTSAVLYRRQLDALYGKWGLAPKENRDYLINLMTKEDENNDKYIQRTYIERNLTQTTNEAQKILLELEDMLNPDLALYPNPTRDCSRMCSFLAPCVSFDDGSDWETPLAARFSERDGPADRFWRMRMPDPGKLAEMKKNRLEPDLFDVQIRIQNMTEEARERIERGEEEIGFTFNMS